MAISALLATAPSHASGPNPAFSFRVRGDRCFDAAFWRHLGPVTEIVRWFAPDVLHFTGVGDVGQLGACVGRRLSIPMVGSWHTAIHEVTWMQQQSRRLRMLFYTVPHVILAPSGELAARLQKDTGKPTFVMSSGVNTEIFRPARRQAPNAIVNIGYVGPLSTAANVRLLRTVESEFDAEGLDVRFTIVGEGAERDWLRQHMLRAEFTGVLSGDSLAQAYAQMDIFAVPSKIDTVGASVLEAMASGVPAVVMGTGGHRFNANAGDAALFAESPAALVQGIRTLVKNRRRRDAFCRSILIHVLQNARPPVTS